MSLSVYIYIPYSFFCSKIVYIYITIPFTGPLKFWSLVKCYWTNECLWHFQCKSYT